MSVNLINNDIRAEQAHHLATILQQHETLRSLCGNRGNETRLDLSGRKLGADGAIMLAPELVANGVITSLNVSNNSLGGHYEPCSDEGADKWIPVMSGVKALAAAIPECR